MWWLTPIVAEAGSPDWVRNPESPVPHEAITSSEGVRVLVRAPPERLLERGLSVHRSADGRALGRLGWTPITVDRSRLAELAAAGYEIVPDRRIDLGPSPTIVTSELTGATAVRNRADGPTGLGVRIANIDSHIEVTHPHFFRADAGIHAWVDVNGSGALTPGVDGVDRDGDGAIAPDEVLWRLEAFTWRFDWVDYEYVENRHEELDPAVDWLYFDLDGDGERTTGRPGWTDQDPGLGEPTFVPDDVNDDGRITPDERLHQLGSSVIEAIWWDGRVFHRGEDLLAYDRQTRGEDRSHGTMVSGIAVGGQLVGQRRYAGLAPEADLVFVSRYGANTFLDLVGYTEWVEGFGADVLLHEYAPWTGFSMDGSSVLESLVDELAEGGMAQVCAAGNLADAGKHTRAQAAGGAFSVGLTIPDEGTDYLELEVHPTPPVGLICAFTHPTGEIVLPAAGYQVSGGVQVWGETETSPAGNRRQHALIYAQTSLIAGGSWTLNCTGPDDLQSVDVYLGDAWGWDRGVLFDDEVRSNTMGVPATAEHCVAVAAYAGRWPDGAVQAGELRTWSSRGPALYGQKSIDLAAPDDPFTPSNAFGPGTGGAYLAGGGTSAAAPHVAAVAGLLKAAHPEWSGAEIRQRLVAGAEFVEPDEHGWGAGRVDAWAALELGERPEPPPPVDVVVRTYLLGAPTAVVEVGDEARWDLGYDGTIDHIGPRLALEPGQVARVDVLEHGYRLGGAVLVGAAPVEAPSRACASASVGWWGGWWMAVALVVARRSSRRESA
jgi:subtilisin family serine protease